MLRPKNPGWMSGIDGTVLERAEGVSLRNLTKRGLCPVEGFEEFVEGTSEIGFPFLGFISSRPNVAPIVTATTRSLALFKEPLSEKPVIHAGSMRPWHNQQGRKARAIVREALQHRSFGFIDDNPRDIGIELVSAINDIERHPSGRGVHIMLGAVAQNGTGDMQKLWESLDYLGGTGAKLETSNSGSRGDLTLGNSALHIVTINELTVEKGVWFGELVSNHFPEAA